jgi:hypothetical protein
MRRERYLHRSHRYKFFRFYLYLCGSTCTCAALLGRHHRAQPAWSCTLTLEHAPPHVRGGGGAVAPNLVPLEVRHAGEPPAQPAQLSLLEHLHRRLGAARVKFGCEWRTSTRVRSHCRFRNRADEFRSESGIEWLSGGAKRKYDPTLAPTPDGAPSGRAAI